MRDSIDLAVGFAILAVGLTVGGLISNNLTLTYMKLEAIKAGVGQYYIDTNYCKAFRYIKP